jgi:hypothetical protein
MDVEEATQQTKLTPSAETHQAALRARRIFTFAQSLKDHPFPTSSAQRRQGLMGLVALCVRYRQAELLAAPWLGRASAGASDPFFQLFQGSLDGAGHTYDSLTIEVESTGTIRLSDGLILTSPWDSQRYARALLRSGPGWRSTPWQPQGDQDGVLYLPWGLYCTGNGNHSQASGILWGDGEIVLQDAVDLSEVLRRVRLEDQGMVREDTGELVAVSEHWSILALIGLGKLLLEMP